MCTTELTTSTTGSTFPSLVHVTVHFALIPICAIYATKQLYGLHFGSNIQSNGRRSCKVYTVSTLPPSRLAMSFNITDVYLLFSFTSLLPTTQYPYMVIIYTIKIHGWQAFSGASIPWRSQVSITLISQMYTVTYSKLYPQIQTGRNGRVLRDTGHFDADAVFPFELEADYID